MSRKIVHLLFGRDPSIDEILFLHFRLFWHMNRIVNELLNMGYSGRTGIAEVLLLSSSVRELILSQAQEHIIKEQARKEGMRTLREDGLAQVFKGFTTIEEVLRVTAPDE